MKQFINQLILGISLGNIYALVALGYTMVYGIIQLINFAHGDILMMGAFFAYYLVKVLGMSIFVAVPATMLFCAILGVIIERVAYKPLRHSTRVAALITAIGVSYLLQNGMTYFFGATARAFPSVIKAKAYIIGDVRVLNTQIIYFALTIVLMMLLQVIVRRTKMGKAMRAVAVDTEAAQLMGISVDTIISFTFALGSALAGMAGVLFALKDGTLSPMMGTVPGLKAFVAAVVGGIGNIPGAMVGGYLIAILETIVTAFGGAMWKDAVVYALLIIILLVMPAGLFGKNVKEKV